MSSADRVIRLSTAAAVVGVAGIAAYVSYWHAYEVVHAHGEIGITARLEPATIDGLVYSSSMVVLYAARHQLPVPRLARWLLALGIVATLAANVAHGLSHGPVGAAVAAWPAASLVGSYELLLWLIRTAGTVDSQPVARRIDDLADSQSGPQLMAVVNSDGCGSTGRLVGLPTTWSAPEADQAARQGADAIELAAAAAYRASLDESKPLSERKLAAMYGKTSRRWARRRMAEARRFEGAIAEDT